MPHVTSCGGYYIFDPSVRQPDFFYLGSGASLKNDRQNFMKLCSSEGHFVDGYICNKFWFSYFFLELHPFWSLKFVQNQIYLWNLYNFVVKCMRDILYRYAYMQGFFWELCPSWIQKFKLNILLSCYHTSCRTVALQS